MADESGRHPRFSVRWMEEIIQSAMARGEFDDLPGKGRPLDLESDEPDSYAVGGSWMVNRVLKNNKAAPLWIELQKSILEDKAWLASVPRNHPERQSRLEELKENVLLYNLNRPSSAPHISADP